MPSESLGRSAGFVFSSRKLFTIESCGSISKTTNRDSWLNRADVPRWISKDCPD